MSFAGSMLAQLPVSTLPQNKKVVLEEFTGIYCGYCPDGHQIANNIHAADPTNVFLVNIHSGGFANVAAGEPDLKTPEGNAIDGMPGMGITGYPAGTVNRTVLTGNVMAGGRGNWNGWSNTIKTQAAYCNVALQGTIDVVTRVLTVQAEVYYTANSPVATNSLNIFLLEDNVNGAQHNYGTPNPYNAANYNPDGSYNHNHVLRKALTPTFGMTIPNATQGTTFATTVTYTIPLTYGVAGKTNPCQLGNLHLVGFVTETNVKTINANSGPITLTGFANTLDVGPNTIKTDFNVCSGNNFGSSFKFMNYGSSVVTSADFDYAVNGVVIGTFNWTGNVNPMTSTQAITIPSFNFSANNTNTLTVTATNINSGADQNAANNITSKSIPFAYLANDVQMYFNFTQDRYGDESTWSIVDEVSNTTMISGGPYGVLGSNGTLLHTDSFIANYGTCYNVIVNDAFGDGVNAGYGVGGYNLKAGTTTVYSSNGQYGKGEEKRFKTGAAPTNTNVATGIATTVQNVKAVTVYPNPASNVTNLSVSLSQNETVSVSVMNNIGQVVYTSKGNNFAAGQNTIELNTENWASGVYFINVSTPNGALKRKLTVTH